MPHIQTERLNMWYERYPASGGAKDPAPILLHAGLSMQGIFWPESLLKTLNEEGFDVIIFDNRDIGQTEHLDGVRPPAAVKILAARMAGKNIEVPYRVTDMAHDSVALMDALDIPVAHIAGMSMGGMIAQEIAIHHPTRVKSLCSWASSTGAVTDVMISPRLIPAMLKPPAKDQQARIREGVDLFLRIGTRRYPSDATRLYEQIERAAERAQGDAQGVERQMAAILATPSRRKALTQLQTPTLVIHGDKDPLQPFRGGKATARLVPDADFYVIPGYGHNLPDQLMRPIAQRIAKNARRA